MQPKWLKSLESSTLVEEEVVGFIDVNTKIETTDKPNFCVLDDISLLIRMEYKPHAVWEYEWCLRKDHHRYVMILWYVFYKSSILNGLSRLSKATQA